ncbi:MAG: HNH endonuclease signature motif containing protein [Candidatus Heimdallarchaeaceae archaeon]
MKKISLVGRRFGKLVVLKESGRKITNNKKRILYKCICDCGKEKIILGESLSGKHTRSCGCLQGNREIINLVDHKYGRYLVLNYSHTTNRKVYWECVCDCGVVKTVRGNDLKNGKIKSCGCLMKEMMSGKNNHSYIDGRCKNIKKYRKQHYKENKDVYYARGAKRRAIKLNQTPEDVDFNEIRGIYKICVDMNKRTGKALFHVDHIIPLSKGGLHHEDNLQILSAKDNLSKASKILYGGEYGKGT